MKKAIALLAALTVAFSVSAGAFAAVNDGSVETYLNWAADTTDANPKLSIEKNQLVIGMSGPAVVLPETYLKPGTEYTYPLYRVDQTYTSASPNQVAMTPVTEQLLGGATIKIRTVKGSTYIQSAQIKKKGTGPNATYSLVIEPRETYNTSINDVEYTLVVTGQSATAPEKLLDATVYFKTGYRSMLDADIDSYSEGDIVTVTNDRPVISKSQFETLAKNYNYKAVTFSGDNGDWTYTGRVSGMGSANFFNGRDVVPDIVNANPNEDFDFKFLTFNAGVTFPTNGEMRIDVSDLSGGNNGENLNAYLYRDGGLTPINHTYDRTSDEIVFRTNYLGAFVVSTGELEDINENVEPPEENLPGQNTNPNTGAVSGMFGLIGLGIASIASGAVIRKNRKSR